MHDVALDDVRTGDDRGDIVVVWKLSSDRLLVAAINGTATSCGTSILFMLTLVVVQAGCVAWLVAVQVVI